PVLDSAGASYAEAGTGSSSGRTLVLYADEKAAGTALAAIEDGVRACPVQRQGSGAPLVHEVVDAELPADESLVFTQQARMDAQLLADLTVFQVARVRNALYVATSSTSAGGPQVVEAEVRRLAEQSAPVLSDLCVVASGRC
ncbi:MAG TPA: hypothetical protein VHN18_10295, partial [Micromonosporaceae bacterium]|nr:hypothetical protein [Micromonosporaceae bacterium]